MHENLPSTEIITFVALDVDSLFSCSASRFLRFLDFFFTRKENSQSKTFRITEKHTGNTRTCRQTHTILWQTTTGRYAEKMRKEEREEERWRRRREKLWSGNTTSTAIEFWRAEVVTRKIQSARTWRKYCCEKNEQKKKFQMQRKRHERRFGSSMQTKLNDIHSLRKSFPPASGDPDMYLCIIVYTTKQAEIHNSEPYSTYSWWRRKSTERCRCMWCATQAQSNSNIIWMLSSSFVHSSLYKFSTFPISSLLSVPISSNSPAFSVDLPQSLNIWC